MATEEIGDAAGRLGSQFVEFIFVGLFAGVLFAVGVGIIRLWITVINASLKCDSNEDSFSCKANNFMVGLLDIVYRYIIGYGLILMSGVIVFLQLFQLLQVTLASGRRRAKEAGGDE